MAYQQSARRRDRPARDCVVMFNRHLSGLSGKGNSNRLVGRNKTAWRRPKKDAHGRHSSVCRSCLLTDNGGNMLGVEHAPFITL